MSDPQSQVQPQPDSEPVDSPTPPADQAPAEAPADGAPADAARQAEEYLDLLRRTRADFANFRRRVEEERAQQIRDASRDLILKLLPVLDDLGRALGSARPEELEGGWGQGVQLIERKLKALLVAEGVQEIAAQGAEFNPWEHEALAHQPTDDAEEGTVLQVVRTGYRHGDRVLRPAQVVVARRAS